MLTVIHTGSNNSSSSRGSSSNSGQQEGTRMRTRYTEARLPECYYECSHDSWSDNYNFSDNSLTISAIRGPPSSTQSVATTSSSISCPSDDESSINPNNWYYRRPPRPPTRKQEETFCCLSNKCPICMEPLLSSNDEKIGVTVPCGHVFHWDCFQKWKMQFDVWDCPTCPTCAEETFDFMRVYLSAECLTGIRCSGTTSSVKVVKRRQSLSHTISSHHYGCAGVHPVHHRRLLSSSSVEIERLKQQNKELMAENNNLRDDLRVANDAVIDLEEEIDYHLARDDIVSSMSSPFQRLSQMLWNIFFVIKKGCIHTSGEDEDEDYLEWLKKGVH